MELVDRLGFRLLEAARRDEEGGEESLTIADVYQRLVPYRAVRGELGILELAEYEHALLRLLAGERGFVRLEVEEARAELERELRSPNPILGLYRDYAAVPLHLQAAPAAPAPAPLAPPAPASPEPAPVAPAPAPAPCHACGHALPDVPDLRFCPACGTDQRERPCASCGATLRPEWNFCVRCGTGRDGSPRARG